MCSRPSISPIACWLPLLGALLLLAPERNAALQAVEIQSEMTPDAELHDLSIVDQDILFAAGDHGVVWRSDDGGRKWTLLPTGVDCRLDSVCFVDSLVGWVAGGSTDAHTHQTNGVLLATADGGRTWKRLAKGMLPALSQVKFFNSRNGWASGQSSSLYPSGLFHTRDGGSSWASVPSDQQMQWPAADFLHLDEGYGAGPQGAGSFSRGGLRRDRQPDEPNRRVRVVRLAKAPPLREPGTGEANIDTPAANVWAAGDAGLLLHRQPQGEWLPVPLPPVAAEFDFQALASVGSHVWAAGTPGTLIFHSPDHGRTWETLPTGQMLPIRSLAFFNQNYGWATGALGTILATRDGGRSWLKRKAGGERTALLGVFSLENAARIPLEVFAQYGASEGYLASAEIVGGEPSELLTGRPPGAAERAREALTRVGAVGVDLFPLPALPGFDDEWSLSRLTAQLQRQAGAPPRRLLEERLVRQIRMWRPDTIVTESVSTEAGAWSQLLSQAVLTAVVQAGDPAAYPQQLSELRLEPWRATRVFGMTTEGDRGAITLSGGSLIPRFGGTLGEHVFTARALLETSVSPQPERLALQQLYSESGSPAPRNLLTGANAPPGGGARRRMASADDAELRTLALAAQRRRTLQQIIKQAEPSPAWLSQMQGLLEQSSEEAAGVTLYQAALRFAEEDRLALAAESFALLAKKYPDHPLTASALQWLVRYGCSAEQAWQTYRQWAATEQMPAGRAVYSAAPIITYQNAAPDPTGQPIAAVSGPLQQRAVRLAAAAEPEITPFDLPQRMQQSLGLGAFIDRTSLALSADPRVRFPMAAAARTLGDEAEALRRYERFQAGAWTSVWANRARLELKQARNDTAAVAGRMPCRRAASKPRLDGRFDDEAWQAAERIPLPSTPTSDTAEVMFAHDAEFLYLAIRCRAPAPASTGQTAGRPRDPQLTGRDRVEVLLDINRDYASYYRLELDDRGWVREGLNESPAWNPKWYVASDRDGESWTIEAAISWDELAPTAPLSGELWAVSLARRSGQGDYGSWIQPADPRSPGFGLLQFTR
ncbi:hypothetical protein [Lignipirellula cremea]|uniref:Ycf48-like protein n=1 Tax=Lignipirellula cremea TaxID=2528010 RepID=A0A518E2M2_9BACT|nr:hypothetical protein [Lignipirellula cremea]QDU98339.1 Ycf48-like protein precursor [Lignipirellula cremea]